MTSFGELVLVLGDFHIPSRASKIPAQFKRMLVPGRMQHVICTGNSPNDNDNDELLQSLAPNLHFVSGGDEDHNLYPESRVVQVGQFRIGVIHGHQIVPWKSHEALSATRRRLNVDILITGHTHRNSVVVEDDYCFINPVSCLKRSFLSLSFTCFSCCCITKIHEKGSITGAISTMTPNVIPSFVLLAVQDDKLVCYMYELKNDEVDVSKTEFSKAKKSTGTGGDPALLDSLLK